MSKPQKKRSRAKGTAESAEEFATGAVREAAKAEMEIRREIEGLRKGLKTVESGPTGRLPMAMVTSRHGTDMVQRHGKGFSLGELSQAGVEPRIAAKWGVWVDHRRRSALAGNIDSLSAWHARRGVTSVVESKVEEVKTEVKKVGKDVERAVEKAEKEIARAERIVKRKPKGARKAASKRKAKPKPKRKKKRS